MIATYKQSIDIGWHDSQRTPQFINSGKYLILPFKNSLRIGFYLQAIRVVIANMNIEIVYLRLNFCLSKFISLGIHLEKGTLSGCSFLTDFFNIDKASFQQLQKLFATLL